MLSCGSFRVASQTRFGKLMAFTADSLPIRDQQGSRSGAAAEGLGALRIDVTEGHARLAPRVRQDLLPGQFRDAQPEPGGVRLAKAALGDGRGPGEIRDLQGAKVRPRSRPQEGVPGQTLGEGVRRMGAERRMTGRVERGVAGPSAAELLDRLECEGVSARAVARELELVSGVAENCVSEHLGRFGVHARA